jgi:hypothetical protein
VNENRIQKDLHPLILEAARRKDEKKSRSAGVAEGPAASQAGGGGYLEDIRLRIERSLGARCGVEGVFQDPVWKERVRRLSRHGERLKLGNLVMGYIDRGETRDYIVLGGEAPAVIAVNPKCPRDKLMQLLSG